MTVRSASRRLSVLSLAGVLGWVLIGCTPAPPSSPPTAAPPSPSPSASRPFVPPPAELGEEGYDPVLISFCIDEELVLGIEARLITKKVQPPAAERQMRAGVRIAARQAAILKNEGHGQAAGAVRAWSQALLESSRLLGDGVETFEALDPATRALVRVNRYLDCEVDA
ncbi:MAG: hypothetical protein WD004_08805 [Actinomycetota bacterium]